jgi:LysM repeat protein
MQYTVKAGDSLSKIALQFNQPVSAWRALYEANQAQIKNPDLIYPGQVLNIPKEWNVTAAPTPPILPPGASSPIPTNPAAAGQVVKPKNNKMFWIIGAALTLFIASKKPKKRRRR